MTVPLAERTCTACRKDAPRLDAAAARALAAEVPGWSFRDNGTWIERNWRFADFASAFAFVCRVADIAEAAGHHPDLAFGWGYVRISLQTHAIGGLHETDFILAARIDEIAPPL
jgi:4a-hydroxytetrahydrobiopterin dehydratase